MTRDVGDYRCLEKLGEGAAGEVYLATPTKVLSFAKPGDPLALKIYKPEILKHEGQLDRIKREFDVGSALSHPNLVRMHTYSLGDSRSRPYLVMEYVDGVPLDHWLELFHPISGSLLFRLVDQLVCAIRELHEHGITHRDLKPANIMISSSFLLKVMDFGVVRINKALKDSPATPSHKFLGTIRNSSPEMLLGSEYDERTDLYSLGTVMFFLLNGEQVFANENQFAKLIELVKKKIPHTDSCIERRGVVQSKLTEKANVLLKKKPNERFGSAQALCEELDSLRHLIPESSDLEPLHGYMATALTGLDGDAREAVVFASSRIAEVAKEYELYVYEPRKATDPILHKDVDPTAVYLLDRKRVLAADLVIILANKPSFGVGQEVEISSSMGKPTLIIAREGVQISRMMLGSFAHVLDEVIYYSTPEDLSRKLRQSLGRHLDKVRGWKRRSLRVARAEIGQKVLELRKAANYTSAEAFADALGLSPRLITAVEGGQFDNVGVEVLARICQLLSFSPKDLFREGELSKPVPFEDGNLRTLGTVARKAGWSASDYLDLLEDYRKQFAADGESPGISKDQWLARHTALQRRRLRSEPIDTNEEEQPGLF